MRDGGGRRDNFASRCLPAAEMGISFGRLLFDAAESRGIASESQPDTGKVRRPGKLRRLFPDWLGSGVKEHEGR